MKGKFYGIGVGPGDPELLTVKAVRILKTVDIIISPESRKKKGSIALTIAETYIKKDTDIVTLEFPMTCDEKILEEKIKENSEIILTFLEKGKSVAFLTLGDPMLYSTYIYLLKVLKKYDITIETVPGITSFCAVASRTGIALSEKDESLGIIPLIKDSSTLTEAIEKFDNVVVMKVSSGNKFLAEKLVEKGLQNNFITVTGCGSDHEEISGDINYLKDSKLPYLTTVIIKKKGIR